MVEPTSYCEVILMSPGGLPLPMMKKLSAVMGTGLKEAKAALASLPLVVAELPLDEACALEEELRSIGAAEARLQRTSRFDPMDGATYTLVLEAAGARRADVERWVDDFTGGSLEPDSLGEPGEIKRGLTEEEVRDAVSELEGLGAHVWVRVVT